ncbi:hypothetical protein [uncultured Duncaniella sp.]|uniref:hypothetical protein n=1 Tax=uncultured Duncaniella sp. TaxID=2768039 RepID=UPI0025A94945|nr:hypothetical protein [uncultured Duncaniella sp.]
MFTEYIKKYLLAIAISLISIVGMAQTNTASHDTSTYTGRSILRLVSKGTDRKRLPSNNYIEILYTGGNIILKSGSEEILFELMFENCLTGNIEIIPSIENGESVPVELETGQYELTAKKLDGNIFYGIMVVESI